MPILVKNHSGITQEVFDTIRQEVESHYNLGAVTAWVARHLSSSILLEVLNGIQKADEFNQDVIVPLPSKIYLVYDCS